MAADPIPEAAFALRGVRQERHGTMVLDGVELELARGRVTALIGPSGAGKTSLLRLLNRLDDPVAGAILYRGRPLDAYPVRALRRRIGFVFQVPVMFPGTVRENLAAAAMLGGVAAEEAEARGAEALRLAELDPALAEREGDRLSVGQRQRANLARALMTGPEVLLMDEPTSALDAETADQLVATIRHLSGVRGLTIVMATHRLEEARAVSDATVMLEAGRVVEAGPTARVFERPANGRTASFLDRGR